MQVAVESRPQGTSVTVLRVRRIQTTTSFCSTATTGSGPRFASRKATRRPDASSVHQAQCGSPLALLTSVVAFRDQIGSAK